MQHLQNNICQEREGSPGLNHYAVTRAFPMMDRNGWLVEKFNCAFRFYVYAVFWYSAAYWLQ
jgi:hypothetical protein